MERKVKIEAAGNIEPPVYRLIKDKGYTIEINGDLLVAKQDNVEFVGYSVLELAGLILLYENKGNDWRVSDAVIDDFCSFFD